MNATCLMDETKPASTDSFPYLYNVYGIALHTELRLPLPTDGRDELAHISIHPESASYFQQAIQGVTLEQADGSWHQIGLLADGSYYTRWDSVGEFLISNDGRQIRPFASVHPESFQVYLLGQAMSFALVNSGFEPVHATAVAVHGQAVVFLGGSGFGKSTLAASFISAGYPLLTDDLLMMRMTVDGVLACPGPARIKLFPKPAHRFLGVAATGVRMNPGTEKLVVPLDKKHSCSTPLPVRAIYSLAAPRDAFRKQSIRIEALSPRETFMELVKNTFNRRIVDGDRLTRQLAETAHLASILPARRLSMPRNFHCLTSVTEAILDDLTDLTVGAVSHRADLQLEPACAN